MSQEKRNWCNLGDRLFVLTKKHYFSPSKVSLFFAVPDNLLLYKSYIKRFFISLCIISPHLNSETKRKYYNTFFQKYLHVRRYLKFLVFNREICGLLIRIYSSSKNRGYDFNMHETLFGKSSVLKWFYFYFTFYSNAVFNILEWNIHNINNLKN